MGRVEEAVESAMLRVARREARGMIAPLSRELRDVKRNLASLQTAVSSLKGSVGAVGMARMGPALASVSEEEVRRARLSPELIKGLRARLGMTQAQLAGLLGVTGPAIAQWESGSSEPRGRNRTALVALRKLGRREADRLLGGRGLIPARKRAARSGAWRAARRG